MRFPELEGRAEDESDVVRLIACVVSCMRVVVGDWCFAAGLVCDIVGACVSAVLACIVACA